MSSEHVSGIFLQLIGLALGNSSSKSSSSGKGEEKKDKTSGIDLLSCIAVCLRLILPLFLELDWTKILKGIIQKLEARYSSKLNLRTRRYFCFLPLFLFKLL